VIDREAPTVVESADPLGRALTRIGVVRVGDGSGVIGDGLYRGVEDKQQWRNGVLPCDL
jgi:hypothetical protein